MTSRLDAITQRMSKLMLKRWPMLAEVCSEDGCSVPLMRDPVTNATKCVWHDARELFPDECFDEEEDVEQPKHYDDSELVKEDEKLDTPKTAIAEDELNELRRRKREQSDVASERIGKRLLQGWAMIDRSCPNELCYNVPLVQDREKVQECVVCNQKYMDEDAYVAKYGAPEQETKPEPQQPTKPVEKKQDVEATMPPAPVLNPVVTATSSAVSSQLSPAISQAVNVLNTKIAELSVRLAAATDLDDIQRISKAIGAEYMQMKFFEQSLDMKKDSGEEDMKKLDTLDDLRSIHRPVSGHSVTLAKGVYPSLNALQAIRINKLLGVCAGKDGSTNGASAKQKLTPAKSAKQDSLPAAKRQKTEVLDSSLSPKTSAVQKSAGIAKTPVSSSNGHSKQTTPVSMQG
ncbi:hypothetical protein GGH19_004355, partial [Coemansia sp. RSA 1807]